MHCDSWMKLGWHHTFCVVVTNCGLNDFYIGLHLIFELLKIHNRLIIIIGKCMILLALVFEPYDIFIKYSADVKHLF